MMNQQASAFSAVKTHFSATQCGCSYGVGDGKAERRCLNKLKDIPRTAVHCPSDVNETEYSDYPDEPDLDTTPMTSIRLPSDTKLFAHRMIHAVKHPPKRRSLLYPAEFRAITRPGCKSENQKFYDCVSQAYVTSRGQYGYRSCATALPKVCSDPGFGWMY